MLVTPVSARCRSRVSRLAPPAASPTTSNRSGLAAMTSSAWVPIEPVLPSTNTRRRRPAAVRSDGSPTHCARPSTLRARERFAQRTDTCARISRQNADPIWRNRRGQYRGGALCRRRPRGGAVGSVGLEQNQLPHLARHRAVCLWIPAGDAARQPRGPRRGLVPDRLCRPVLLVLVRDLWGRRRGWIK